MYRNSEGYRDPVAGKAMYLSGQKKKAPSKPRQKPEQKHLNYFAEPAYTNPAPVPIRAARRNIQNSV